MEAKVAAELDGLELLVTAERPRPRELTYADLSKLEYLQAVVKVMSSAAHCKDQIDSSPSCNASCACLLQDRIRLWIQCIELTANIRLGGLLS